MLKLKKTNNGYEVINTLFTITNQSRDRVFPFNIFYDGYHLEGYESFSDAKEAIKQKIYRYINEGLHAPWRKQNGK